MAEAELDTLPTETAQAITRALSAYQWRSDAARKRSTG